MSYKFLMGLFTGILMGVTAALMYAPAEGVKTRQAMREAALSTGRRAGKVAAGISGRVSEKKDRIKQAI